MSLMLLKFMLRFQKGPLLWQGVLCTAMITIVGYLCVVLFPEREQNEYFLLYPTLFIAVVLFRKEIGFFYVVASSIFALLMTIPIVLPDVLGAIFYVLTGICFALVMDCFRKNNRNLAKVNKELSETNNFLAIAEAEKGTLLREAIHRFRNDLQRLSTILTLQSSKTSDAKTKELIQSIEERVNILASLNGRLDITLPKKGQQVADSKEFLSGLVSDMIAISIKPITVFSNIESHKLDPSHAVAVGQILYEWITNCIKYAFPDDKEGNLWMYFGMKNGKMILTVEDDGVGCLTQKPKNGTGLGDRITRSIASTIHGHISINQGKRGGTFCKLTFDVNAPPYLNNEC